MKTKILVALGFFAGFTIMISACSDGTSSSSVFSPRMSSSWPDGGNYNPGACCFDTVYIENGQERYHRMEEGICPPPRFMTVSCEAPVRVNMDSIKAIESKPKEPSILIEDCLQTIDLVKQGLTNDVKKAKLIENHGFFKIEFWKQDYCSIDAGLSFERSGDTLSLKLTEIRSAETCKCYSKHQVDIPASEKDFSYFKFDDKVFEIQ